MESQLIEKTDEKIKEILNNGIDPNNLEHLYKLSKIRHMAKEEKDMRYNDYGNYGRRYEPYGNYNEYGRRGYDMKYRGNEYLGEMYDAYNRYSESKNYGAHEDSKKGLEFMLKSAEDFFRMLRDDAQTPEEQNMIRQALQRMAQM